MRRHRWNCLRARPPIEQQRCISARSRWSLRRATWFLFAGIGLCAPLDSGWAQTDQPTNAIHLNPTGRTVLMTVPLKDGTSELGDISIKMTSDDRILLSKAMLIERLGPLVTSGTIAKLQSLHENGG